MALLVRLRRALLRSSSIPNCCSFSPIPSDSSHLINLSKIIFPAASRLENPSIRPTPSKHDRRPPHTCSNRFLSDSHYRQHETKIPKDEIDSPTSPKPSPEEMIETFFQNLAKVMGSVEDAKVIEQVSDKLNKSSKEMIGQLEGACRRQKWRVEVAKVIEEMFDKFEKNFGLQNTGQLKGDKCWNEVITPRSPSQPPEYENHVSEEDLEMIDEMHEKLTKYVKVLKKLKVKHAFTPYLPRFYIHGKGNKFEDATYWNEVFTPRQPALLPEYKHHLSVEDLEMIDEMHEKLTKYIKELKKLKDYVDMMETTDMQKECSHIRFSPKDTAAYASMVETLKGIHAWRLYVLERERLEVKPQPRTRPLVLTYTRRSEETKA